jgi:hypothetical protein
MELPKHVLEVYEIVESDSQEKYLPLHNHLEDQIRAERAEFERRKEKDCTEHSASSSEHSEDENGNQ